MPISYRSEINSVTPENPYLRRFRNSITGKNPENEFPYLTMIELWISKIWQLSWIFKIASALLYHLNLIIFTSSQVHIRWMIRNYDNCRTRKCSLVSNVWIFFATCSLYKDRDIAVKIPTIVRSESASLSDVNDTFLNSLLPGDNFDGRPHSFAGEIPLRRKHRVTVL